MNDFNGTRPVASPTLHFTLFVALTLFVITILFSVFFSVEVVSQGQGKIIPIGRVQILQAEHAGRVHNIYVENGVHVQQGDLLVQLDPTESRAQLVTLYEKSRRLEIESLRISSLLEGAADWSSSKVIDKMSVMRKFATHSNIEDHKFYANQKELLLAEITELEVNLKSIEVKALVKNKSTDVIHARIESIIAASAVSKERLFSIQSLHESGLSSRSAYLDALDVVNQHVHQLKVFETELDQRLIELSEFSIEIENMLSNLRSRSLARQSGIESELAVTRQQVVTAKKHFSSTGITAPVNGVVDQLKLFTIGGIVKPGMILLQIVPSDNAIEVEAFVPNLDVGFLVVGQEVVIRIDAFPSERYGSMSGTLATISPNSVEISPGMWGYRIRVTLDCEALIFKSVKHTLRPGMTVKVDVITSTRKIISYFFAPIVNVFGNSLGEQ